MIAKQKTMFESGNEMAAFAAKQINYHVMGYYPITPSTQIAEFLDLMKAEGEHDISMIAAEGEHSAAGICYGASAGGGRVLNATSANGLLYALEQLPVQSGTRFPMVMNVACRTVSGPLCIKGDHSDIMYTLNTGWIILFASTAQEVYDFNICALKLAEEVRLPVIVAFDGFFTSHQKTRCFVFERDEDVQAFIGQPKAPCDLLDMENPITVGSYMNEPDVMNNKYQLHQAMEEARRKLPDIFSRYRELTGRGYSWGQTYKTEDADVILFLLGSSYHTAKEAVDEMRAEGKRVGLCTANILRPFPAGEIARALRGARTIVVGDRQDSYGAGGGNMSLEIKAALLDDKSHAAVISRIYGLGGKDFYVQDAIELLNEGLEENPDRFDYYGVYPGRETERMRYFDPISEQKASPGYTTCTRKEDGTLQVKAGTLGESTKMPKRLAPGHGACPGCGIPVNVNLLLKGIEGNVVLLFQTGCGMVVTTPYPKTAFKVPYIHNLFQNGAATLAGLVEMYYQRQKRGELPEGEITFIMVSGDGGMDIGMGSAIGTALRNNHLILLEYDNGGYMNTGYQLSYSTPMGAKSSTSHVGKTQYGKTFFHKDTPQIMAATGIPYVATAAESNPLDFIRKAAKAQAVAREDGMAYIKCLSACPLNWGDKPNTERSVIGAAVDCCYFPLYEVERGNTLLSYDPEKTKKKIPVEEWLGMMGRTKHLIKEEYRSVVEDIQQEIDRRFLRLKERSQNPYL
ncbi:thiamine pyrophosphate-dependent enzyme [Anaerolentibacter hominis]|uniref:thiamine pyrophosphate-dependent enzyme n=1 Tax=Anaerolentibacter hominis TaxID=3079009 RepID=UPI0031B87CA9